MEDSCDERIEKNSVLLLILQQLVHSVQMWKLQYLIIHHSRRLYRFTQVSLMLPVNHYHL